MRIFRRFKGLGVFAALASAVLFGSGCRTGIRQAGRALMNQGSSEINYEESADKTALRYFTSENSQARLSGLRVEFDDAGRLKAVAVDSAEVLRMPSESHELFAHQLSAGGRSDTQAIKQYADMAGGVVGAAVTAALQHYSVRGDSGNNSEPEPNLPASEEPNEGGEGNAPVSE